MKPLGKSITNELVSACSSLDMEVTYQGPLTTVDNEPIFISNAEPSAAHSIEHIYSAIEIASEKIRKDISRLQTEIHKLELPYSKWEKLDLIVRDIERKL